MTNQADVCGLGPLTGRRVAQQPRRIGQLARQESNCIAGNGLEPDATFIRVALRFLERSDLVGSLLDIDRRHRACLSIFAVDQTIPLGPAITFDVALRR